MSKALVFAQIAWTVLVLTACTATGAVVSTIPEPTPTASIALVPALSTGDLAPVSISNPSPGAKDAFAKCHVGDQYPIDDVAGMGEIPLAKDLLRYVPLTGREPQLKEVSPAWVIQFRGDLPEGAEIWTDPICVVTAGDSGFYATGPVKDLATGTVHLPEPPPAPPDRTLLPLVP